MKTGFIPLDYDYFDYNDRNFIKIYGKNSKGEKICVIDSCPVYFWAILKDKTTKKQIDELTKKIEKIKLNVKRRQTNVEKVELHEKNFLGEKVKALKIYGTNYKDLHDIADHIPPEHIEKRRGYDLGFITHYIIEKKIYPLNQYELEGEIITDDSNEFGGINSVLDVDFCIKLESSKQEEKQELFNPKILAFDIETDEFEVGKGEILMISLAGKNFRKVLTSKSLSKKSFVKNYKNEKELLEAFVKEINEFSPDILTGYFSDGFDLPYIKSRADKHNVKLNLGLDNSQPRFSRSIKGMGTAKIGGIVHIDLLKFIKNAYSQYLQSETLSLNEVASELLGEKKLEFNVPKQLKNNKINWDEFYEYNLQDSILTYKLFEKIWPDIEEITKITKEPLFSVSRSTMAGNFEDFILHNLERFNEIPEKRPYNPQIEERRSREKYEGAFVFQPQPGLYENLGFFDFSSMYGSIIVTYNLSKSTITQNKNDVYTAEFNKEKIFFKKQAGFLPELLKEIILKRRKFKEDYNKNPNPLLKARSNAFKLIANAAYGYQGFFGARYYCVEAAAATAYFARENIKKAIKIFENNDFKPVYSDTDSIAVLLGKKTKKQAVELLKKINQNLPGIMELDLEGFFKRGIWVTKRTGDFGAKKKYALLSEDDKIKIRGFETVRRDWCGLSRKVQDKIIRLILKEGNEKKALSYLKEVIKKIKSREVEIEELIIKTQLKKSLSEYKSISPHVIAAKRMKELKIPVSQGNLIEYYISEPEDRKKAKLVREKVKLPQETGDYDIEYYLERQIIPAVENIFQIFSIDAKELISEKSQTSLSDF